MKITALALCAAILAASCATAKTVNVDGAEPRRVTPYGFFDEPEEGVHYELSGGNIFWSIVLLETIVVPVILLGKFLYNPVGADQ